MESQWTTENIEEQAIAALGEDLATAAILFPRVVFSVYVGLSNADGEDPVAFTPKEFRRQVCKSLPSTVAEVLPFFVRNVWNRKWTFESNGQEIRNLAEQYAYLLEKAGYKPPDVNEMMQECRSSFAHWQQ
jgi:hypothetical protein